MSDGSWNPVFHPIKSKKPWATDYAEGNPWQYLWLVPQDVEGLIELLGGEKAFADKLNTFFSLDSGMMKTFCLTSQDASANMHMVMSPVTILPTYMLMSGSNGKPRVSLAIY